MANFTLQKGDKLLPCLSKHHERAGKVVIYRETPDATEVYLVPKKLIKGGRNEA